MHGSRDACVRVVGAEPALAECRDVVVALSVDEEGVVVPNHVGGVDGEEVGEWEGVWRLRPKVLHLVGYLDEFSGAVILLLRFCCRGALVVVHDLRAVCLPLVAMVSEWVGGSDVAVE